MVAVGIAGKQVDIADVGVKDSGTGVRIERGAVGINGDQHDRSPAARTG